MEPKDIFSYYSRKDIQEAILDCAKEREVGAMLGEMFGKRPDVLEYPADIGRMARQGVTSFHISEERWKDPLSLRPGMSKKELDENRCGWDLLIDIDTPHWDYAKWTAYFVVEALKFHNIKHISVKFSGGKGWHIGVPFEAFPDVLHNGVCIKDQYPDFLRIIAAYLQEMIRDHLSAKILEKETVNDISTKTGKQPQELLIDGKFDPFKVIEIDTVLISSRHMFRAPYSLHDKKGLVSLPIEPSRIMQFDKEEARPEKVKPMLKFLDRSIVEKDEAKELFIQAFDWHAKKNKRMVCEEQVKKFEEHKIPTIAISESFFPPCVKRILAGNMSDGKKRSLFVLINFLRHVGWDWESIEKRIREWNEKNPDKLHETYWGGQLSYAKKSQTNSLPPNCANANYYKDMRLCEEKAPLCDKIRNPVNFTKIRAKSANEAPKRTKKN